ncbi:MAG: tripartite tricarboxylate transporter substrate binding protein [Proteobacteria bacterium]|nr:tripartite tricarboxylate transporter substrate binding protein [Pseudomonadota bacterium]MBS0495926.1 tripartite tricarboxylate transporter substrate binding protein [Pseudomonadota bacterium]
MHLTTRRSILLAMSAPLLTAVAHAQSSPAGTAALIVTTPPGSSYDIVARRIQPDLAKALNQTLIVENVPGASGSLGAQRALTADGAGLKLLIASPNEVTLPPLTLRSVRYKPSDFRLVCQVGTASLAMLVRPGLPASNLHELIEYARRPGAKPLAYGSSGIGSVYHLVGAEFSRRLGLEMTHVPYKGGVSAVQDLMGNQIDMIFLALTPGYIQMTKAGQIKILGMLDPERNPALPNVPSIDEVPQLQGFHHTMWTGLFVPSRLPLDKAAAVGKAAYEIVAQPAFRDWLLERGATPGTVMTLDQATAYFENQSRRFEQLARSVKIEIE